ncbi:MAG: AIM24 family protein [Vicinamibacterales bacterium]|nr:AIM24 family protein [Vicinamibacterales bacterium]
MDFSIDGTVAQSARLTLAKSETVWASKGSIIAYASGLKWDVKVPGGLAGALKRSLSGEGITLAYIEGTAGEQVVTLGANAPGHIHEWDLETGGPVLTTRGAFLAAWGAGINITVAVARRPGAALFGGAGLVLQRIEGSGTVLIHGRGDFRQAELAQGEELRVSTGNLAAFSAAVDYNVETVGSLRKTFFSKEGLFMTRLTGPGTVLLQTLKPGSGGRSQAS